VAGKRQVQMEKESGKRAGAHEYNKYVNIDCSQNTNRLNGNGRSCLETLSRAEGLKG
jgi:hypothetical protein